MGHRSFDLSLHVAVFNMPFFMGSQNLGTLGHRSQCRSGTQVWALPVIPEVIVDGALSLSECYATCFFLCFNSRLNSPAKNKNSFTAYFRIYG